MVAPPTLPPGAEAIKAKFHRTKHWPAIQQIIKDEAWRRGDLSYKRHATQRRIHAAVQAAGVGGSHFLCCSRRLGKTFELFLEANEYCIQHPGSRVLYLMPHAKDAAELASDTSAVVYADCPAKLKPEYKAQSKEFTFPNGSILRLKGVNGEHAQFLRGGAAHLVILDECGLMDDLKHVVNDVVMPMTMTTGGKVLFATTPARSPGHESFTVFSEHADAGAVSIFTIRDAPHVTDTVKMQFLVKAGEKKARVADVLAGTVEPEATTTKREYFCMWVTDADTAVVPEYDAEARQIILVQHKRPDFFDAYVSMDPGFNDKTGILYAYLDFLAGVLVIEDESLLTRAATPAIAREIQLKETANWGEQRPCLRISDVDLRLCADLWTLHGLAFTNAEKADAVGGINLVRTLILGRKIRINPKCVNLDRQIRNAVWNSTAKDFDRTDLDSHFDLLSALRYLCRGVNWTKNPFPAWYSRLRPGQWASTHGRPAADPGLLGSTPFGRRVLAKRAGNKVRYGL